MLARLGAGQWFGELGLFDHESRSHDAYTDEACLLWHATQAGMLALLAQQPEMWPASARQTTGCPAIKARLPLCRGFDRRRAQTGT